MLNKYKKEILTALNEEMVGDVKALMITELNLRTMRKLFEQKSHDLNLNSAATRLKNEKDAFELKISINEELIKEVEEGKLTLSL